MKKLFLFALFATLCCSCTESNTDENTDPNGGSNSGQTTPPDPDSDAKDVIHVPKGGMLAGILNELGLTEPSSLKLSGTLGVSDFTTLRNIQSLEHLDISRVNLSVLPTEAFLECTNIKSVILPNTLTAIGTQAFCLSSLVSISIPAGVKTIGNGTFNLCTALQTVTFEKGTQLKTFDGFQSCRSLTTIEIPASVETIKYSAFNGCTSLKTVTFEKGSELKTIEGYYQFYGAFSDCTSLTSIEIPASVETIGICAFSDCTSLTSIEIPASVETIEWYAFSYCTSLKTVTFEKGSKLKMIQYNTFRDCTSLTTIEIPASVETIERGAFSGCTSLQTVTFEKGSKLKTIGYFAFINCTSLTTIEIPASVETIRGGAFSDCTSLKTVTFEKGSQLLTVYGYYAHGAFSDCTALTTVDMSACTQVTEIGYRAFYEDSKLQLFKIGTRTPPSCEDNAFWGINSYSVLKVPAGCVDAYKKAKGWKEFTTISELDE